MNRKLAAEFAERQATQRKKWARTHQAPASSPVTITRADGTQEVRPPLSQAALRRIVKDRPAISDAMRDKVLKRDRGTCRYCGNDVGPFELDHVTPVALGGATTMANLVTACVECNRRKGVQIWTPNRLVH